MYADPANWMGFRKLTKKGLPSGRVEGDRARLGSGLGIGIGKGKGKGAGEGAGSVASVIGVKRPLPMEKSGPDEQDRERGQRRNGNGNGNANGNGGDRQRDNGWNRNGHGNGHRNRDADDRDQDHDHDHDPDGPPPAKRSKDVSLIAGHYNARPEVGKGAREASPIIGLKNFNNWVKSVLILRFAHPALSESPAGRVGGAPPGFKAKGGKVLDLGCGKGGDLSKWQRAPVMEYVGVGESVTWLR
jgi:hypothetical protein